jgi:hypothetical protein
VERNIWRKIPSPGSSGASVKQLWFLLSSVKYKRRFYYRFIEVKEEDAEGDINVNVRERYRKVLWED